MVNRTAKRAGWDYDALAFLMGFLGAAAGGFAVAFLQLLGAEGLDAFLGLTVLFGIGPVHALVAALVSPPLLAGLRRVHPRWLHVLIAGGVQAGIAAGVASLWLQNADARHLPGYVLTSGVLLAVAWAWALRRSAWRPAGGPADGA
ncbi:hypothetical protein KW076_00425 [Micrococcus porci]|uniref:hypothetical protein n=1 Tax=Micrococcus porci TaxID=2856555 RepID=UPI001CCD5025|nr:hypothetical protein [Micrococcus porci]UBH24704.1 hypothetical protein KW076_00425 [Micrococcus porci]